MDDSIALFTALLKTEPQVSEQFRINYVLPSDVEVALKYTQTWGFHLEAEKTYEHAEDLKDMEQQAKSVLDALAQDLDIAYINDELMDSSKKTWAEGKQFGKYAPDEFKQKYGQLFE